MLTLSGIYNDIHVKKLRKSIIGIRNSKAAVIAVSMPKATKPNATRNPLSEKTQLKTKFHICIIVFIYIRLSNAFLNYVSTKKKTGFYSKRLPIKGGKSNMMECNNFQKIREIISDSAHLPQAIDKIMIFLLKKKGARKQREFQRKAS